MQKEISGVNCPFEGDSNPEIQIQKAILKELISINENPEKSN